MLKTKLIYKGNQLFAERRKHKRCPRCQFFAALAVILLSSLLLLFLLNTLPRFTTSGEFLISTASTYEINDNILIDADLIMNFSADVVDALENGIPLMIAVEVQVFRERFWWRNIIIKESLQLFELRYHPLTDVHEVKNMETGERYSFNSREDAMATLGTIRGARLIEKKLLGQENQYFVQMRTLLDINQLPMALRQIASLSSSWRLESPWYRWPITSKKDKAAVHVDDDNADFAPQLQDRDKFQHKASSQPSKPVNEQEK